MGSFKDLASIARDANFQDRIRVALELAATNVMAESNATTGHTFRIAYAQKVLDGQADIFDYAIGVLDNSTIAAEADVTQTTGAGFGIPDGDIQFTVNSLFSAYSGVAN